MQLVVPTLAYLPARRRAAQRAFIISESRLRPAAVKPPAGFFAFCAPLPLPCLAQRARAAAESFARVAADMGRR